MFDIRDPIHRTISFSEAEKPVIDHPYVQRLRHIRQLGLSYLVYPGATHDRFSHACGAMHVAGRLWDGIVTTSAEILAKHFTPYDLAYFRRMVRLGGLLHDLGHPPFSHPSERFMPQFTTLEIPAGWMPDADLTRQASHEDYSVLLIAAMAQGEKPPFDLTTAQDIASLIHHGVVPSEQWTARFGKEDGGKGGIHILLRSLISGELDCDRMDYLLRDAYFTGASYGMHDLEHLVGNMGLVEKNGGLVRTIDSTAVRSFEDFLLARYHMFLQVYLHKTTLCFDHYMAKALEAGEFEYDIPGDAAGYAKLRDGAIYERLFTASEKYPEGWAARFVRRQPSTLLLASSNVKPDEKALMDKVAGALNAASIPSFSITTKQYLSKRPPKGEEGSGMLVRRKLLGELIYAPIEQYSSLLNKYNEVIDATHLYVLPEHAAAAMKVIHSLPR